MSSDVDMNTRGNRDAHLELAICTCPAKAVKGAVQVEHASPCSRTCCGPSPHGVC